MFHTFPGGRSGVGLLLLRAALGIGVLIQAGVDLKGQEMHASTWIVDWLAAAAGVSLVVGVITPIAAVVIGLTSAAVALSVLPEIANVFASRVPASFVAAVAVAVALLGPGAFSVDARLFGLREIIIPPYSPTGKVRGESEEDS